MASDTFLSKIKFNNGVRYPVAFAGAVGGGFKGKWEGPGLPNKVAEDIRKVSGMVNQAINDIPAAAKTDPLAQGLLKPKPIEAQQKDTTNIKGKQQSSSGGSRKSCSDSKPVNLFQSGYNP